MYELENIKEDFFEDLNLSHSTFQIENFILGSEMGLTPWGKYKQCLRELHRRVRSLKDINYQIAKKEIEIKRLEQEEPIQKDPLLDGEKDLDYQEHQLDVNYQKDNLKLIYEQKAELRREGSVFLEQHDIIKKEIRKLREEGKSKEDLEKEYWVTKLKRDLENNILSTGTANAGLVQSIRGIADQDIAKEIFSEFWRAQVQNVLDKKGVMEQANEVVKQNQLRAKSS